MEGRGPLKLGRLTPKEYNYTMCTCLIYCHIFGSYCKTIFRPQYFAWGDQVLRPQDGPHGVSGDEFHVVKNYGNMWVELLMSMIYIFHDLC